MNNATFIPTTIAEHGYLLVPQAVAAPELMSLADAIGACSGPGRRGLAMIPEVSGWSLSASLREILRPYFNATPRLVRALFFNKSPEANWYVTWHQDLTIAVRERVDVPGFGPWSVKDDVPHVQPPAELLDRMLAVRLHFDVADETNGALRVIPGSHSLGRLNTAEIERLHTDRAEVVCRAEAGDLLLMRPLLLHASSKATSDRPRRVLHLEFADFDLPGGLMWREA